MDGWMVGWSSDLSRFSSTPRILRTSFTSTETAMVMRPCQPRPPSKNKKGSGKSAPLFCFLLGNRFVSPAAAPKPVPPSGSWSMHEYGCPKKADGVGSAPLWSSSFWINLSQAYMGTCPYVTLWSTGVWWTKNAPLSVIWRKTIVKQAQNVPSYNIHTYSATDQ